MNRKRGCSAEITRKHSEHIILVPYETFGRRELIFSTPQGRLHTRPCAQCRETQNRSRQGGIRSNSLWIWHRARAVDVKIEIERFACGFSTFGRSPNALNS